MKFSPNRYVRIFVGKSKVDGAYNYPSVGVAVCEPEHSPLCVSSHISQMFPSLPPQHPNTPSSYLDK